MARPSLRAPPPRTAEYLVPWTWSTTSATRGPSRSRAHRLVFHHGSPLLALVDPSTGSRTTTTSALRSWAPDSSLNTPSPARSSTPRAAVSATRSWRYWWWLPADRPQSDRWSSASRTADAASLSASMSNSSVTTKGDATVVAVAVRDALPSDLQVIARLIRDLADYEHLAHEVVFDEAELGGWLFGDDPAARVLLATEGDADDGADGNADDGAGSRGDADDVVGMAL